METVIVGSWREFEDRLRQLEDNLARQRGQGSYISKLMFRGQADAHWRLQTTLERYCNVEYFNARRYFIAASEARHQIEANTGKIWDIDLNEFDRWEKENVSHLLNISSFPAQKYMLYLRHHGFPSPILDWTVSPYVAAYFAFKELQSRTEKIAIFAYVEWTPGGRTHAGADPLVWTLPYNVAGNKRHFVQQSQYTVCAENKNNRLTFVSHETAYKIEEESELIKYILPAAERLDVLRMLDRMNVNGASLFETDEGLMDTLALRQFHLPM